MMIFFCDKRCNKLVKILGSDVYIGRDVFGSFEKVMVYIKISKILVCLRW